MKKINLGQKEVIHFVGIGGIGMSGLAQIMKNMGFKIQGSDQSKNKNTLSCSKVGIKVFIGHSRSNVKNSTILVRSSAIKNSNSEIKLYDALSDIALGRTIIIVSNRVWHLRLCNRIFVLDEGKIIQSGSFEDLKEASGVFGETYKKQMSILGFETNAFPIILPLPVIH